MTGNLYPDEAATAMAQIRRQQEQVINAVLVIAALTAAMIFGARRRARIRSSDLLGGRGAIAIVGLVWLVVALTLGIAFALRAAGTALPATIATAAGGAVLAAAGPHLMRKLRMIMLSNRAGSTR
jgi:hypothetical protein